MTKNKDCCKCIIISGFGISTILVFTMVFIPLLVLTQYVETTCLVSNTKIPISLPNKTYSENWVECNCGRRCDYETPCVQVFVNIENSSSEILLLTNTISWHNNGTECTFKNKRCENNIIYMIDSLELANNQIEPYKNNSNTFVCFTNSNSDKAFLKNELALEEYLPYLIIFGFFFLLFCCIICQKHDD